jgi:threonine synthase
MQYVKGLRCVQCNHLNEPSILYQCVKCSGSLDVEYYYEKIFENKDPFYSSNNGIWKYRNFLPVKNDMEPVTLGEGNTPLLKSSTLATISGVEQTYLKVESVNPTLSFKDRPLSVALTVSKQFGIEKVTTASTGNTGVAAAAYSARAGMPCQIFIPKSTPKEKLRMMKIYGAEIQLVEGNFSDAYEIAGEVADKNNWLNLTSTFLNPFAIEGNKTVAYELYEQYKGVPDWIIIPIGAGPLLVSCYKGFKELKNAGKIDKLPKMAGVQAENCSPIVQAFNSEASEVKPWINKEKTIASGIADPLTSYPNDGTRTLHTIRESGGAAIAVTDEKIKYYQLLLAKEEGIFAEPASITAVAAMEVMNKRGLADKNECVVGVITGHGVKDLEVIKSE